MAKQALKQFPFNREINEALKEKFGAKWDKTCNAWTVFSKEKAVQANALIDQVVTFERDRMIMAGEVEFHNKFNDTHPGYVEFHPLTGASWNFIRSDLWARAYGFDRVQAKAEFDELKTKMGVK